MTYAALGIAAYFVAVLVLALRKPVEIRSRWVQLLRFLLPSWRFFDELGQVPVLSFRQGDHELGTWTPVIPPLERSLRRLVLNADGNFALACESLVAQLVADAGQDVTLSEQPSYRLVCNLVAMRVTAPRHQWRVQLGSPNGQREDAIVSPVLP